MYMIVGFEKRVMGWREKQVVMQGWCAGPADSEAVDVTGRFP